MPSGLENVAISRRGSVSENAFQELKALIDRDVLAPGFVFPNEVELSKQLGIGRSSLREAFKKLESRHYISRSKRGTKVTDKIQRDKSVSFDDLIRESTIRDLIELRIVLEQEIAARAAKRATDKDIVLLKRHIRRMEESLGDVPALCYHDASFHYELADISGNQLYKSIFAAVQNHFEAIIELAFKRDISIKDRAVVYHHRILEAVGAHDDEAARSIMKEHIENVKHVYFND